MKLLSKLTLYTTLSKTAIALLFIVLLPVLVSNVAFRYTDNSLKEQQKKVLQNINRNGINYYFEGDSSYGSYTMLKDEFISLEPVHGARPADTLQTSARIVEHDTLNYRLLDHVFAYKGKTYLLEIGRTLTAINQYNRPLQKVALYTLVGLIAFTLLFDLFFTRLLLRPLSLIIRSKLQNRQFPFKDDAVAIKTSTSDFHFLDDSLIKLMQQIREAFEKEREFTSNASHELMTPISILQNKIENLLLDQDISDQAHDKIEGMLQTLHRLKKIVRALLLISRIENDQFARTVQCTPRLLVEEVLVELDDKLIAGDIRAGSALRSNVIIRQVNRDLIFQLLYNLINNAIRYNKQSGSIRIGDILDEEGNYKVFVEDTGIGIKAEELATIFNRFKRSGKRDGEGYGLGLSIVKTIAQYHGITIGVESSYGRGSRFTLIFPASLVVVNDPANKFSLS